MDIADIKKLTKPHDFGLRIKSTADLSKAKSKREAFLMLLNFHYNYLYFSGSTFENGAHHCNKNRLRSIDEIYLMILNRFKTTTWIEVFKLMFNVYSFEELYKVKLKQDNLIDPCIISKRGQYFGIHLGNCGGIGKTRCVGTYFGSVATVIKGLKDNNTCRLITKPRNNYFHLNEVMSFVFDIKSLGDYHKYIEKINN